MQARARRSSRAAIASRSIRRAANAGLRKHQLDLARGLMIAGDLGDDGANLLVAGHHQEGRRAAIGLRADDHEAGFGLRELGNAMRRNGAAGMEVGIDQRRQLRRRLDGRVELDAKLAQEREIGPEAGRHHDAIDVEGERLAAEQRRRPVRRLARRHALAAKGASIVQPAVVHGPLCGKPERAALRQFVVEAATEQLVDAVAAQRPEDLGPRLLLLQLHQRQRDVDGRMAAADHQNAPAGIAVPLGLRHVRNAVGDELRRGFFAWYAQAVDADRVGLRPRSRGVDDGARAEPMLGTVAILVADTKAEASRSADQTLSRPSRVMPVTVAPSFKFAAICGQGGERLQIMRLRSRRRSASRRGREPASRRLPAGRARRSRYCSATARKPAHAPIPAGRRRRRRRARR